MEENTKTRTPLRSVIIGAIGSIIITASSVYVALRVGAVPWPTVFATILSVVLLRIIFKKTTTDEINIAQTGMTAGAMIGGALAFTIPAIFINNPEVDPNSILMPLLLVSIAGLILGAILTWIWKEEFIVKEELPYPIGVACAETIKVSTEGKGGLLFTISAILTAIFTVLRDKLAIIPQAISSKWLATKNFTFGSSMMPLALSIGYMIGPLSTLIIMVASVVSFNVFMPISIANNWFQDFATADSFRQNVGLGVLVGTGFGIFLGFIIKNIKNTISKMKNKTNEEKIEKNQKSRTEKIIYVAGFGIAYILMCLAGIPIIPAILVLALIYITTLMAVVITGQSGIDPFEVFGIIGIIILTILFPNLTLIQKIMIAAVIAVASGFAGDTMFDYKAGHILGTNSKSQLISQVIGGAVGVLVACLVFILLVKQYGFGETGFLAPQSRGVLAIAESGSGLAFPIAFWVSVIISTILCTLKVPTVMIGLGIYLPFILTFPIFIGGMLKLIFDKVLPKKQSEGMIVASGIFGGESITSVVIAILSMIGIG